MDSKAESESVPCENKDEMTERSKRIDWLATGAIDGRKMRSKAPLSPSLLFIKTTTQKSQTACIVALRILKTSNHS